MALVSTAAVGAEHERRVCTVGSRPLAAAPQGETSGPALLGPGLVFLPGANAAVACTLPSVANDYLLEQVLAAEESLGLDVQLSIVFSTVPTGCGNLYYFPVKNDVRGIGYASTDQTELFDRAPGWQLQGIAFLNDIPYFEAHADEFRTAFLHEVGHRFAARVNALKNGVVYRLTGRQGGHWSYFLDSEASPLEGNSFDDGDPTTTTTPHLRLGYSRLDRYLMGLLQPEEVGPIRLLEDAVAEGTDCAGHTVNATSPPQWCAPMTLRGSWVTLSIDDVIAAEGERVVTSGEAPTSLSVAVFVFGAGGEAWSQSSCEWLSRVMPERFDDFARATGSRMWLRNAVTSGSSCEILTSVDAGSESVLGGGCSLSRRVPRRLSGWAVVVLVSLLAWLRPRSRELWCAK